MFEVAVFDAAVRQAIRSAGDDDSRVVDLVDAMPLAPSLLRVGERLGETEEQLRTERRLLFAQALTARDNAAPSASEVRMMRRVASELRVITRHENLAEIVYQIIEWRMVGERVARIEAMARS